MNESYKEWNFEDFISFLLYHAAMADFKFADEEKKLLLKHVSEEKLNQIKIFHKNNSDYENIQVFMYCKDKFCTDSDAIQKVESAVKSMFDSDGEYNLLEKNMSRAIELLMSR